MKGRKLSLQEVLNLEDGCKVWVEDTILNDEQVGIIEGHKIIIDDGDGWFDLNDFCEEGYVIIYEWIEKLIIQDKIETPYYSQSIVHNLATEILNLRNLDLTDENIEIIIREFS